VLAALGIHLPRTLILTRMSEGSTGRRAPAALSADEGRQLGPLPDVVP
jgi:hypothetical protein